jgi:hypothetical protein
MRLCRSPAPSSLTRRVMPAISSKRWLTDNLDIGDPRTSARSAPGAGYAVTLRSACRTAALRALSLNSASLGVTLTST